MASFVVTLGLAGLVYATITNYVWCVVDKHKACGYASPLANVRDWGLFMKSVQVECHEPSEPRVKLFQDHNRPSSCLFDFVMGATDAPYVSK